MNQVERASTDQVAAAQYADVAAASEFARNPTPENRRAARDAWEAYKAARDAVA